MILNNFCEQQPQWYVHDGRKFYLQTVTYVHVKNVGKNRRRRRCANSTSARTVSQSATSMRNKFDEARRRIPTATAPNSWPKPAPNCRPKLDDTPHTRVLGHLLRAARRTLFRSFIDAVVPIMDREDDLCHMTLLGLGLYIKLGHALARFVLRQRKGQADYAEIITPASTLMLVQGLKAVSAEAIFNWSGQPRNSGQGRTRNFCFFA